MTQLFRRDSAAGGPGLSIHSHPDCRGFSPWLSRGTRDEYAVLR